MTRVADLWLVEECAVVLKVKLPLMNPQCEILEREICESTNKEY
jgi:hypothetical protein